MSNDNPNFDWQALINQAKTAEQPKQEQVISPPIIVQPIQQINNDPFSTPPKSTISESKSNPLEQMVNSTVEQLTELNSDIPEENEEEELLEGEQQPTISFSLTGIDTKPKQPLGLETLFNVGGVTKIGAQDTGEKRGRGRPRKIDTAQAVIDNFPAQINTIQEQSKSTGINQNQFTQTKSEGTEKTITLNKKALQQIAEGIIGIGTAIKEFAER